MSDEAPVFLPAFPYVEADEKSLFSKFEPGTRILPAGFQTLPQYRPTPVDIVFEKDTAVTLRDGTTIYVDVFRPAGTEQVPVIVAWSPYGKSQGTDPKYIALYSLLGLDLSLLSGLAKFEGPDPAFWCANGYAVCNPDARGVFNCDATGGCASPCGTWTRNCPRTPFPRTASTAWRSSNPARSSPSTSTCSRSAWRFTPVSS
ncbi:MAG TPA: CocE/NonD family hydrolase [Actinocrinis sp.]|nr:CocE/NonD family hydrolase [Actinocrinis sp.]